jgi:hypothetical protein
MRLMFSGRILFGLKVTTFISPPPFQTLLLPNSENKPLDVTSLEGLSTVLESHSSKSIALHLLHGKNMK